LSILSGLSQFSPSRKDSFVQSCHLSVVFDAMIRDALGTCGHLAPSIPPRRVCFAHIFVIFRDMTAVQLIDAPPRGRARFIDPLRFIAELSDD
jgi:hypothetical protein